MKEKQNLGEVIKIDLLEEKIKDKKKRVYIAYGSNMDICRMDKRCSDFEFFGIGYIYNYRLTFQQSVSGFYANLISNKSKKKKFEYTSVVLYLISEEDEKSLDMYEGYPQAYKKTELEVELEDGSKVKGLAYVLPSNKSYGVPTIKYYRLIENAYKIFGFDLNILKEALVFSYKKAKTSINSKINSSVKRILPKKSELTTLQKEFVSEFNQRNKSDWELKQSGNNLSLIKLDSSDKSKDKVFNIFINKDKSISLQDVKTNCITTVTNIDSLLICCNTVSSIKKEGK